MATTFTFVYRNEDLADVEPLTHGDMVEMHRTQKAGETLAFRLLDDDGIVYFIGYATCIDAAMCALDRVSDAYGATALQVFTGDANNMSPLLASGQRYAHLWEQIN